MQIGRCENPECRNITEYGGISRNITEYGGISRNMPKSSRNMGEYYGISRYFPRIYRNITIFSDGSQRMAAMRLFINMVMDV